MQSRALCVWPECLSYLGPRSHVTEVHRPWPEPPLELVGHLCSQGEQVAAGCVPGEARSGDGQLPGAEGGRQAASSPRSRRAGTFPPPLPRRERGKTRQRGYLQPVPGPLPVAADALLRQAVQLQAQVGQGERQEGQLRA